MEATKILDIVKTLDIKTKENQVIWNRSSGANGYKLILNSGMITLDKWVDDYKDITYIEFIIYNDNGEKIEKITYNNAEENTILYNALIDFHTTVRRKYLKADETLNSIFDEISKEKKIGKDVENKPSDDLPF